MPDPSEDDLGTLPLDDLLARYRAIDLWQDEDDAGTARAELADRLAAEALRRDPDDSAMLFDRGLFAKWRRDWDAAAEHAAAALDLVPAADREGEPAAWNLGIAATARRDWATARRAWTTFGIAIGGSGEDPIAEDLGVTPVRLNAPPRFIGQQELLVDGEVRDPEVVWGTRLDPARVQLLNVPLPSSGHRCGDVVLHDGDPNGSRVVDDEEFPVFDELELWERSPRPTLSVVLTAASDDDVEDLLEALDAVGLTGEDWTTSVRNLCRACSEGAPGAHDHPFGGGGVADRTVGISGLPEEAEQVLDTWRRRGDGRGAGELTVELA